MPCLLQVPTDADFCNLSLENLEAKCVRSLNGYRSTQRLLRLVPDGDTFRVRFYFVLQTVQYILMEKK